MPGRFTETRGCTNLIPIRHVWNCSLSISTQGLQEVSVLAFALTTRNQNQAGMLKSASLLAAVWRRTEINHPKLPPKNLTKIRGNIAEPLDIGIDAIPVE